MFREENSSLKSEGLETTLKWVPEIKDYFRGIIGLNLTEKCQESDLTVNKMIQGY